MALLMLTKINQAAGHSGNSGPRGPGGGAAGDNRTQSAYNNSLTLSVLHSLLRQLSHLGPLLLSPNYLPLIC
eukprot:626715-Hanusia_phi.AAC.1